MLKEATLLGIAGIVLAIAIVIKTKTFLVALIPLAIGIALILFSKEDTIENRKDKK